MSTTTKRDFVKHVAQKTSQSRSAVRETIQCFLDYMTEQLSEGNRVEFRDFGVFELRDRQQRVVRNPQTHEQVIVPASKSVKFKCGRAMRRAIEQAQSDPAQSISSSHSAIRNGSMVPAK